MSGSAGGQRVTKDEINLTLLDYRFRILEKYPLFQNSLTSGSSSDDKVDYGDIDMIVELEGTDKTLVKRAFAEYMKTFSDDVIVPFKSEKYKGKKLMNTGEIITILYPVPYRDKFVQIDNIISLSPEETVFKKKFLDYPAEIQGLMLGITKVLFIEKAPNDVFRHLGIRNIPPLEKDNEHYEFNLSSYGLTLRIVTYSDTYTEIDRREVAKFTDWYIANRIFKGLDLTSFDNLLANLNEVLENPRSKQRIRGIFKSMVTIKSGEIGTEKAFRKQAALDKVEECLNTN